MKGVFVKISLMKSLVPATLTAVQVSLVSVFVLLERMSSYLNPPTLSLMSSVESSEQDIPPPKTEGRSGGSR